MRPAKRLGILALAGMTVLWIGIVWIWSPSPVALTVDDSFYYLQTARNVAEGYGSTFDRVQPTNGYHPLWLLALVPVAGMEGGDGPVRWALTLQLLLVGAGMLWLARSGGFLRRTPSVLAFALLSFSGTKILVNGQESALQWFLLCGLTAVLATGRPELPSPSSSPGLRRTVVGILGGLATLARLEAVIFGLAAALLPVLWPRRALPGDRAMDRDRDGTDRRPGLRIPTPPLSHPRIWIAPGIVCGTSILYGAWSLASFGHPLPVSAAIKSRYAGVGWPAVLWALGVAVIAGGAYRRLVRTALTGSERDERRLRALAPLLVYCVFFGTLHSSGGWRWALQIWYLAPFLLLAVTSAGWAVERISADLPGAGRRAWIGILVLAAAGYLGIAVAGWSHRLDPTSYSTDLAARRTGRWIRDSIPPRASLAGWDIGSTAWYSGRGITNLEGLAASWEYKREVLDRGRVAEYVNEIRRFDHLVQPLPAWTLRGEGALRYAGVDLAPWSVLRSECVRFRSVVPWRDAWRRVHLVLGRSDGPRLGILRPSDLCPVSGSRPR